MTGSWPLDPRPAEWTRAWVDFVSRSASALGRPTAAGLPMDPLGAVLDLVRERLVGRRLAFRAGSSEGFLSVEDVSVEGGDVARSVGQCGTVRVVSRDVQLRDARIDRLEITANNVHLRPGSAPTVVAAPIHWKASLSAESVERWLAQKSPRLDVALDGSGIDVGLARRVRWARLEIDASAEGKSVRLRSRALRLRNWRIGMRLPSYNVALRQLPERVLVTGLECDAHGVTVRGVLTEWQRSLTRGDVERLMSALRSGIGRLEF